MTCIMSLSDSYQSIIITLLISDRKRFEQQNEIPCVFRLIAYFLSSFIYLRDCLSWYVMIQCTYVLSYGHDYIITLWLYIITP